MIVVKYPFNKNYVQKYRMLTLIIVMILLAVPVPMDFIFYVGAKDDRLHCQVNPNVHNAYIYEVFRSVLTLMAYVVIPFIIMFICSIINIIEIRKAGSEFKRYSSGRRSTTYISNQGVLMMLFVSFAFFVCVMPYYTFWFWTMIFNYPTYCRYTQNLYENVQKCMGASHPVLTHIFRTMRDLNHTVNFPLYCLSSNSFRSESLYYFVYYPYQRIHAKFSSCSRCIPLNSVNPNDDISQGEK
ncbi:hypothetical protein ACOME3_002343 [Neoechinorhynchus agilis]